MYQRLFEVTLVLFLAIVSIAFLAILLSGLMSMWQSPLLAGDFGIVFAVSGSSMRRFTFLVVAAVLLMGGILLWRRRRRLHR